MVGARVRPPAHPPPPPRLELPHHNDAIMTDYHEQMMEWTTQHEHSELARTPERGAFSEPSWELQHKQQPNAGFAAALPLASRMVALLSTVPSIMHSALSSPCSAISIDRGVPALPQLTMHPSVTASVGRWEDTYRVADFPTSQSSTFCQAAQLLTTFRIAPLRHGRKRTEWRRQ